MLKLFRKAGIPRRTPPRHDPRCSLTARSTRGIAPEITSPRKHILYTVRTDTSDKEDIPFTAVTDADVNNIFWFVDDQFIGKALALKPYFWKASPGKYLVRAVDDHGRASTRELRVQVIQ